MKDKILTEEERKELFRIFFKESLVHGANSDPLVSLDPLFDAFEQLIAKKLEEEKNKTKVKLSVKQAKEKAIYQAGRVQGRLDIIKEVKSILEISE